jgi:hypothetical protein
MGRVHRKAVQSLCLVAALACCIYAQDYRARIQGQVTDATKAVVVGAKVTLTNVNQGVESVRTTGPTGTYVFDFVDPGTYTLTVEAQGFRKFVQQNILVQTRGDITIDVELQVGMASQTVEVTEAPAAIQFNTANRDLTIDNKMVRELPLITRNPFKLAALDPAVVNTSGGEQAPYHHWAAQDLETGGGTNRRNDILIDGTPVETGPKTAYTPNMDAVAEFTIQQNSVDAEFGHSAGGIITLAMKSGTNEYHGSLFYLGRTPRLNAVADRTVIPRSRNRIRHNVFGGTLGHPMVRNKLFNFFSFEDWRTVQPWNFTRTMPTDLERNGDFSRTLTARGTLRPIYDPWTTKFDPARNVATRQPFPGNIIPKDRMDPLSVKIMEQVWRPNNPGADPSGRNNFQVESNRFYDYWNLSDRVDWHINERWKVFGRYSQFHTVVSEDNLSGNNSQWWPYDAGSIRHGLNIAGDAVYTRSATTVLNLRGAYNSIIDQYDGGPFVTNIEGLAKLWPNKWFEPYMKEVPQILPPRFDIDQSGQFARGNYWFQRPKSYSVHSRLSHYLGSHYLKEGLEMRGHGGRSARPDPMRFYFNRALTADTFIAPNTANVGDGWATFLLGALDGSSYARYIPMQKARFRYWGAFLQDDFKVTRRLTLNLGLRWEYETAPWDPEDRVSRYLDLDDPIPEMVANPPKIPADVAAMMKVPYKFTGAWYFAEKHDRQMWNSPKLVFLPRVGAAFRVNDKTALRAGWARFVIPAIFMPLGSVGDSLLGSLYMPGFNADTYTTPVLEGIPTARFYDPFPPTNPLIMPVGKSLGRYTGIGGDTRWSYQDVKAATNDRLNLSLQREVVNHIVVDATYFVNLGHNLAYDKRPNLMDPSLSYTYKAELSRRIPNPFYMYLTPEKFPGQLRNRAEITKADLLKPYPHYGTLTQQNTPGPRSRYHAFQLRAQRPFAQGFNLLLAYNYNREKTEGFFNADDEYAGRFTFLNGTRPRHRIAGAGVLELPFGKGRHWLNQLHPVLEGIVGGWQVSSIITWESGSLLTFGEMEWNGQDPKVDKPTPDRWFKTEVFARAQPYTPRTNPRDFPGLTGPGYFAWDGTVSKSFALTERFRLELRVEAYNVINNLTMANPSTSVTDSLFGKTTRPRDYTFGRQLQYSLRLHF